MSGTGVPDFLAPTRLTPVAADQAIGTAADGGPVMPSMYFSQMIQRILSYLGQPASSVEGQTLTDQILAVATIANTALTVAQTAAGSAAAVLGAISATQDSPLALVLPLAPPSQSAGNGPKPEPTSVTNASGAVAASSVAFPSSPPSEAVSVGFPSAPGYAPTSGLPLLPPAPGLGFPVVMALRYFGF